MKQCKERSDGSFKGVPGPRCILGAPHEGMKHINAKGGEWATDPDAAAPGKARRRKAQYITLARWSTIIVGVFVFAWLCYTWGVREGWQVMALLCFSYLMSVANSGFWVWARRVRKAGQR